MGTFLWKGKGDKGDRPLLERGHAGVIGGIERLLQHQEVNRMVQRLDNKFRPYRLIAIGLLKCVFELRSQRSISKTARTSSACTAGKRF